MRSKNVSILILVAMAIIAMVIWVGTGISLGGIKADPLVSQMKLGLDIEGGVIVTYEVVTDATGDELDILVQQTRDVLANRINDMGLTEPNIYIEGNKRIKIELPGVENAEQAVGVIGSTAQLMFCEVKSGQIAAAGEKFDDNKMTPVLYGDDVSDAGIFRYNGQDITRVGKLEVSLSFTDKGSQLFADATQRLVNRGGGQIAIVLDNEIISAPYVHNTAITGGQATIMGNFTDEEAKNLALLIRGGALPAEMRQLEYTAIGPTLGRDALNSSIWAALIGFVLVAVYMLFMYRLPGAVAVISLILYSTIILALMVAFKATLTLPGIAGFVLSIGMAVDANVIIFERIKEELVEGKTLKASLGHGFSKALSTILDANITTLIAAIVLFQFGTGPIKGFAITLMLGILTSMFTAILVTRLIITQLSKIKALTAKTLYGA